MTLLIHFGLLRVKYRKYCLTNVCFLFLFFLFFQKMDRNRDGVVTIEEFIETCQKVMHTFLSHTPVSVNHNYSIVVDQGSWFNVNYSMTALTLTSVISLHTYCKPWHVIFGGILHFLVYNDHILYLYADFAFTNYSVFIFESPLILCSSICVSTSFSQSVL